MNETMDLIWAFIAGILLGGLFFGGLWWTTRKGMASAHPALWFLGSSLLRTGLLLGGFYLVADGDWRRLLTSLVGFVVARMVLLLLSKVQWMRPAAVTEADRGS